MDPTIRDLAVLRGTFHLIDKTDTAIMLIDKIFEKRTVIRGLLYGNN